ncbi:MAG: hypothetical protein JW862_07400 [Anaerolineales bacterium]|nr:hypothetical protein [Anaerolineales bacterium]
MSRYHKALFSIHTLLAIIVGAPLLLAPGRTLGLFDWTPIDPLITRLLGAALLALAWSSFMGARARERQQVDTLIVMEIIFTSLGAIGWLRHLVSGAWPPVIWLTFLVLVLLALAWILAYFSRRPKARP